MTKIEELAYLKDVESYAGELADHINQLAKIAVSTMFAESLNRAAGYMLLAQSEANRIAAGVRTEVGA